MKAVRYFSILLIFSVQCWPAVIAHLQEDYYLLNSASCYLKIAMQEMVTMETVVERLTPTALRIK